jgi:hypothetical protein
MKIVIFDVAAKVILLTNLKDAMITPEQIQAVAHQIAGKFNPIKVLLFGISGARSG